MVFGGLKDLCALGAWKDHNTILKCYQQPDPEAMRLARRTGAGSGTLETGGRERAPNRLGHWG